METADVNIIDDVIIHNTAPKPKNVFSTNMANHSALAYVFMKAKGQLHDRPFFLLWESENRIEKSS